MALIAEFLKRLNKHFGYFSVIYTGDCEFPLLDTPEFLRELARSKYLRFIELTGLKLVWQQETSFLDNTVVYNQVRVHHCMFDLPTLMSLGRSIRSSAIKVLVLGDITLTPETAITRRWPTVLTGGKIEKLMLEQNRDWDNRDLRALTAVLAGDVDVGTLKLRNFHHTQHNLPTGAAVGRGLANNTKITRVCVSGWEDTRRNTIGDAFIKTLFWAGMNWNRGVQSVKVQYPSGLFDTRSLFDSLCKMMANRRSSQMMDENESPMDHPVLDELVLRVDKLFGNNRSSVPQFLEGIRYGVEPPNEVPVRKLVFSFGDDTMMTDSPEMLVVQSRYVKEIVVRFECSPDRLLQSEQFVVRCEQSTTLQKMTVEWDHLGQQRGSLLDDDAFSHITSACQRNRIRSELAKITMDTPRSVVGHIIVTLMSGDGHAHMDEDEQEGGNRDDETGDSHHIMDDSDDTDNSTASSLVGERLTKYENIRNMANLSICYGIFQKLPDIIKDARDGVVDNDGERPAQRPRTE